jgi:hypothetical protein
LHLFIGIHLEGDILQSIEVGEYLAARAGLESLRPGLMSGTRGFEMQGYAGK